MLLLLKASVVKGWYLEQLESIKYFMSEIGGICVSSTNTVLLYSISTSILLNSDLTFFIDMPWKLYQ